MSELIDVVCDICGRQYRWPDERLGDSATCRYCGTKFEVTVYVAPEEDRNAKDLRWFKGVGVALLVLIVVVGLSSLLVVRPTSNGRTLASRHPPSGSRAAWQFPADGHAGRSPTPNADEFRARFDQRVAVQSNPPATGIVNHTKSATRPAPVTPLPTAPADPSATTAPVVTEWNLIRDGFNTRLRLLGRGFQGVRKVQQQYGIGAAEIKYTLVSDDILDVNTIFLEVEEVKVFVVTTVTGVAIVFSDNIRTIDTAEPPGGPQAATDLFLIRKGGRLKRETPCLVLVDEGGQAQIDTFVYWGYIKRGGELRTARASTNVLMEPGATAVPLPEEIPEYPISAVTFCRLPLKALQSP